MLEYYLAIEQLATNIFLHSPFQKLFKISKLKFRSGEPCRLIYHRLQAYEAYDILHLTLSLSSMGNPHTQ